jgi:hypothetical protein
MKMKQKAHNHNKAAGMGTPKCWRLDRIIFGPLPIIVHVLRVLLHVRVKLILHE